MNKANECSCPSGDGSLVHPCPAHPAVEQAGGDERDFQAKGAQEVPSPVSKEYDRHLISLLRKGEALPGHQEEAADEIERLRDWNDHLNNTVLPNILNPNFLMLMKGGERLLDLCTKDGKFIGVSLNDMKDVFDWMVTHARIAPDHAALAQPSPASDLDPLNLAPHAEAFNEAPAEALKPEQAEAELDFSRPLETENGEPVKWICADVIEYKSARVCVAKDTGLVYSSPYIGLKIRNVMPEQAEAERPEVVAYRTVGRHAKHQHPHFALNYYKQNAEDQAAHWRERGCEVSEDELMTVAQHERIVKAWIERWKAYIELSAKIAAQRDAALARVAELEKQEPVATVARVPGEDWNGLHFYRDLQGIPSGTKLYTAPVAQAQHCVPELLVRAEDFVSGKEVPQAWLDVQAERRRQITAEGWTPEHDDLYCAAELPRAAAAYILNGANDEAPAIWPFSAKWWKPRDARSNYVRAGALILAEIERLDRAAHGKEVGHE
ncbi:hypothetical protein [Pseudomonas aeruginosa]|uniref:hypothetical protein n=1 Tax=Pseudomonas aeruginosa TaxID=287 RepID=UPI000A4B7F86|nr:hypothetical protein [Pseudomonas aeruginosa]